MRRAIIALGDGMNIDGFDRGGIAAMINHRRRASNCCLLRDNGEIWIVAGVEGVNADEELTHTTGPIIIREDVRGVRLLSALAVFGEHAEPVDVRSCWDRHGGTHGFTWQTAANTAAENPVMDAATLYMILTLADGSRHAMALQYSFASITECEHSARFWETGRAAEGYRRRGAHVRVFCGAPTKPLIIAR